MRDNRYSLTPVLEMYPADCRPIATAIPASGGFSGSKLWKLETPRGPLCLRAWPKEYPDAGQLGLIHRVLQGVDRAGFSLVPVPIRARLGDGFVRYEGALWELSPWLPGEPAETASPKRIEATTVALADFHLALAACPAGVSSRGSAPGLLKRLEKLNVLISGDLQHLNGAIADRKNWWPELAERWPKLLASFQQAAPSIATSFREAVHWEVTIRPCIRDVHRQHVLFDGGRVTGMIDFGALQPDNVACDVARLLGSLASDNASLWQLGLAAFEQRLPLSEIERRLVRIYDASGVLLAGINWLQWVFVDGRQFENRPAVLSRFDEIAARLVTLANRGVAVIV